ncbi:cytochrome c oxidase assembly factor Coa1 family protein [Maribacter sp. 2307ULW6-5]|uniref:cytochrome c oxidase assembly factor Coa1 family protein n=1 Tax=Maribacter sp. 2307ULW6-5 TaxID=3386275 RepID=UPI0039BD11AA
MTSNQNREHPKKNGFKRNWKWVLGLSIFVAIGYGVTSVPQLGTKMAGMAKVHTETQVLDSALVLASGNQQVVALLGTLQPLGKLAIVEGSHRYAEDYGRLEITVDVRGDNPQADIRSKMDVVVTKKEDRWQYELVQIRIKKPRHIKQTIPIFGRSH